VEYLAEECSPALPQCSSQFFLGLELPKSGPTQPFPGRKKVTLVLQSQSIHATSPAISYIPGQVDTREAESQGETGGYRMKEL
jgi:hypothetical protein